MTDTSTCAPPISKQRHVPEHAPFEEVAAILDKAAIRARGGPPSTIPVAGWHLAAALNDAGCHVVRRRQMRGTSPFSARQIPGGVHGQGRDKLLSFPIGELAACGIARKVPAN